MTLPNQQAGDGEHGEAIAEAARPSFRTRFRAWWEGYDLPPRDQPAEALDAAPATAKAARPAPARADSKQPDPNAGALDRHGKPLWSATRIEVAEKLWGEGFIGPGGADYVPDLVKPLGLDKTMSVLDLSA